MAYINMSCGQTFLSDKARANMSRQVYEPIYYPKYYACEEKTADMLKELYKTKNDVLIATGTGTYGIEMGLRSVFEPGEKVLVINTGIFGAVAKSIAEIVGIVPVEIKVQHGQPVDLDNIRNTLKGDRSIRGLYVVHDETTTGAMQPLDELGEICREFDLIYAVDAISSIGGVELETDAWGIDLCFASAQKCINGPQGLVMTAVSPKVWDKIKSRKTPITSLSLDLETWKRYHEVKVRKYHDWWKSGGEEPRFEARAPHEVSPPATLVWGLQGALEDILEEGLVHVFERHKVAGQAVRAGVDSLGLERVTKDEKTISDVVTVIRLPMNIDEKKFREIMLMKYGVAIGNGEIGHDNVRIGTMGMAASSKYVLPMLSALENSLTYFGVKIASGDSLRAAQEVFSKYHF